MTFGCTTVPMTVLAFNPSEWILLGFIPMHDSMEGGCIIYPCTPSLFSGLFKSRSVTDRQFSWLVDLCCPLSWWSDTWLMRPSCSLSIELLLGFVRAMSLGYMSLPYKYIIDYTVPFGSRLVIAGGCIIHPSIPSSIINQTDPFYIRSVNGCRKILSSRTLVSDPTESFRIRSVVRIGDMSHTSGLCTIIRMHDSYSHPIHFQWWNGFF